MSYFVYESKYYGKVRVHITYDDNVNLYCVRIYDYKTDVLLHSTGSRDKPSLIDLINFQII